MSKKTELSASGQVLVDLGQKADAFCVHFTTLGAETFGRAERSAIAAGYGEKSARNRATALLKKPEVQARISELHTANMSKNFLTTAKVLNDLESVRLQAVEKSDLSAAIRASELQGKFLAMFTDRQELVAPEMQRELDEREAEECRQIALIRLRMQIEGQGVGEAVGMLGEAVELSPVFTPSLQAENRQENGPDGEGYHPRPPNV